MPDQQKPLSSAWQSAITTLLEVQPPFTPAGAHAMTVVVEFPPGDIPVRYTVTMLGQPGMPMLTLVDEEELARRPAPASGRLERGHRESGGRGRLSRGRDHQRRRGRDARLR